MDMRNLRTGETVRNWGWTGKYGRLDLRVVTSPDHVEVTFGSERFTGGATPKP